MNIVAVRNCRWADADKTMIDCDIELEGGEVLPFTATKDDEAKHGREVFLRAVGGRFGEIKPFASPRQMTPLEFIALFEPSEQTAIATAAMQNVAVKLWYDKAMAASYVDLDDPRTVAGVKALSPSLLSKERVDAILATKV